MSRSLPTNVAGFRREARRRLPTPVFDFVDGGAEDELTERDNEQAFRRVQLWPRPLTATGERNLRTTVCGIELSMPVMTSPTGFSGLVHPDGELGALRAASAAGTAAVVSSGATYSIEELRDRNEAAPWFQLYPPPNREIGAALLRRAALARCPVLVVTVDVPMPGNRERDTVNGMTLPPTLNRRNATSLASHPAWLVRTIRNPRVTSRNYDPEGSRFSPRAALRSLRRSMEGMSPVVTWDDLFWLRDQWTGPLLVKGVLHPDDASRAVDLGFDGVIVSNHGGRQLDGVPASLDALPGVVAAIGDRAEVLMDGGVRRGTDVVKALCLGARAVLIGRPYVFGLAVAGERGVRAVLEVIRAEIDRTLALIGVASVTALGPEHLTTPVRAVAAIGQGPIQRLLPASKGEMRWSHQTCQKG